MTANAILIITCCINLGKTACRMHAACRSLCEEPRGPKWRV